MNHILLRLLAVLAVLSLACTISFNLPASQVGEMRTVTINEPAPEEDLVARVEIEMLGGTLNITGGSSGLVTGTIEYNVVEWEPVVKRDGQTIRIEQDADTIPIPFNKRMVNRWNLQLGSTPMQLEIGARAFDGNIDLSGVPILRLEMDGGASDAEIRFDSPNPVRMEALNIETGASNTEIYGLGNANFAEMTFTGSAGDYLLDFGGQLQEDAQAEIKGTVGDLTLIIPSGQAARVTMSGALRDIDTRGEWDVVDDVYITQGTGPTLNIDVEMSVGNLELVHQ